MYGGEYCSWHRYRDQAEAGSLDHAIRTVEVGLFDRVRWSLQRRTIAEAVDPWNPLLFISNAVLRSVYRTLAKRMSLTIDETEAVWHGLPEFVSDETIQQVRSEELAPRHTLNGDFQRNVLFIDQFRKAV